MKRLFLILTFLSLAFASHAQLVVPHVPEVTLRGSRVFVDDVKLKKDFVLSCISDEYGKEAADAWVKNRKGYKAGLGLTISGSYLMISSGIALTCGLIYTAGTLVTVPVIGFAGVMSGDMDSVENHYSEEFYKGGFMISAGMICGVAGLAMLVAGIPTICVYQSRLENQFYDMGTSFSRRASLTFGGQKNGLGFALNF